MLPSQRSTLLSRELTSIALALLLASSIGCQRKKTDLRPPAPTPVSSGSIRSVATIEEFLEGQPGLIVTRSTNGGYSVRVRGVGSFMSSEEPLWIVDGTQVDTRGRGLNWLNPADVVRIEVLKNAVDTAIYGVRGSNGVIVITTKRSR